MRVATGLILWALIGFAVWNGFYDLYVSRGAREYLQMSAEAELGRRETPSMVHVMAAAQSSGARAGSYWATFVVGSGWATIWLARRRRDARGS